MSQTRLDRPDGSTLFVLAGDWVRDDRGVTLGRASGRHFEVDGRRRGRVEGSQVLDVRDQPLLDLDGDELKAIDGRVLGQFVGGDPRQRGVLALAYATFGDRED